MSQESIPQSITRAQPGLNIAVDKLDEITSYLMRARAPEAYNPSVPFTLVPNNMVALDLEKHMPHPARIREELTFSDVESFVLYYNNFKSACSPVLFAYVKDTVKIKCVFDYHQPGIVTSASEERAASETLPLPQWGSHVAWLALQYHPDYAALLKVNEKWMDQKAFALLVEENTHLFENPSSADMMELAQHLKAAIKVKWQSGKRLSNGEVALSYIEETQATGIRDDLLVPEYLYINSPIYEGLQNEQIKAAFRWRITPEKQVVFSITLLTKLQERAAERSLIKKIEDATDCKILRCS
jgi:hypothetical protein